MGWEVVGNEVHGDWTAGGLVWVCTRIDRVEKGERNEQGSLTS